MKLNVLKKVSLLVIVCFCATNVFAVTLTTVFYSANSVPANVPAGANTIQANWLDSFLSSTDPAETFGNDGATELRNTEKTIIDFPNIFPSLSSVILDADLYLYNFAADVVGTDISWTGNLVNSSWVESTVTWNSHNSSFAATPENTGTASCDDEGYNNFDITSLISEYNSDQSSYHGILLSGGGNGALYISKDNGTGQDTNQQPYLIVVHKSVPEIEVYGGGNNIDDGGGNTPSAATDTEFGDVVIGNSSDAHTFTITNAGDATLTISSISVDNTMDFSVDDLNTTISAGGCSTFTATFQPGSAGVKTGIITINNNDDDENPFTFNVNGTGLDLPFVDITNANVFVANDVLNYTIGGTNNAQVVGIMTWSNDQGGSGTLAASASWTINNIGLAVGANVITVTGTNVYGTSTNDTVTITRLGSGTGAPFVDVTNDNATVTFDVTTYTIGGTNNAQVVGGMSWANDQGGSGTLAATTPWEISGISLAVGANVITVTGTNVYGTSTNDTVTITRLGSGTGAPFVDITNDNATVTFDVTIYTIGGTNNAQVVGDIVWTNTLTGGSGNVPISNFNFQISNIPIDYGDNLITVSGTNIYGQSTNDVVSIHRKTWSESAPQIATNALVFPKANSIIFALSPTNIFWDVEKITDDIDGTNLTITKIDLHYADTTNFILEVTNNVANSLGKIEWRVPPGSWDGSTNYIFKFEVVDSSSLTNSRIFGDNIFIIVPEPCYLLFIIYQLLFINYWRKLNY